MIFLDAALRRQTLHFLAFMIQIASDDRQNSFQANHLELDNYNRTSSLREKNQ